MRLTMTSALMAACLSAVGVARADDAGQSPRAAEQAAWAAAAKTAVFGPATIKLRDQATLQIAADQAFIPAQQADAILRAAGNQTDSSDSGMVVSRIRGDHWWDTVRWIGDGYVRDGDAKDWQPDALLQSLRDNTERANLARANMGVPPLDIVGWLQPPSYDAVNHRLVWSISARDRGADPSLPQTINYNTYALGRHGYFSLDMITGSDTIGADQKVAVHLLDGLNYNPGDRYADFKQSSDHVAAYGLAALIGVVAVKKLSLLAAAGIFAAKIWKIGLLALAAAGAAVRRKLGLKPRARAASGLDGSR